MIELIVGVCFFMLGTYLMYFAIREMIYERKKNNKISRFNLVVFLKASLLLVLGLALVFRVDKLL